MIFNFGDNPTLDVFRMLMHYAAQQKNGEGSQVYSSNIIDRGNNVVNDLSDSSGSLIDDGPRRLHITNLPFKIRDTELKSLFEVYGVVVDAEIIFNERGSKGFGFVTMETVKAAAMAKEALNGKEVQGRKIEVNNATPRSNPLKISPRSKNKSTTAVVKTSFPEILPPTQPVAPAPLNNIWPPQAFTLSSVPVPSPQLTISPPQFIPPPPFSFAPSTPISFPGFHCYPTPEQYAAQYYSFMRHAVPKSGSIGNYRFQPY